jgi:hypothetical protein
MSAQPRKLQDLVSVGPATLRDLDRLGIRSVAQLARARPAFLYQELCRVAGHPVDICCLDAFTAAVVQARDPRLPVEQCGWWYWSRRRKEGDARK